MRIDRLDLHAYGAFTDVTLDFAAPGVHLVLGPNEAGKSTALMAISDVLFGIPTRTTAGFLHDNKALKLGVALRGADGNTREFIRVKKRSDTLSNRTGDVVPDAELEVFLAGVTRETFATTFGLNHQGLVDGGKDLASGKGEVGRALFQASSGSASLAAAVGVMDAQATALLSSTGRAGSLSKAIGTFKELQSEVRAAQLRPREFVQLAAEIRDLNAQLQRQNAERSASDRARLSANLLLAKLPQLRRWHELVDRAAALRPTTTVLRDGIAEELEEATTDLRSATDAAVRATTDVEKLSVRSAEITVEQDVLQLQPEIKGLADRRAKYTRTVTERAALTTSLETSRVDARSISANLRPGLSDDDASRSLLIDTVIDSRLRALGDELPVIEQSIAVAAEHVETKTALLASATAERDGLGAAPDTSQLSASLTSARSAGDLEAARQTVLDQVGRQEDEATTQLSDLRLSMHTPADAAALAPPSAAEIERARSELDTIVNESQQLRTRADEAENERSLNEAELARLIQSEHVPSEVDLHEARRERDRIWTRIRSIWLQEPPARDTTPSTAAWVIETRPPAIADVYEEAIATTDTTADLLRSHADTVAQRAELERTIGHLDEKLASITSDTEKCASQHEQWTRDWTELWRPTGVAPEAPAVMSDWLIRFAAMQTTVRSTGRARVQLADLEQLITSHRTELLDELTAIGVEVPPTSLLATVVERAGIALAECSGLRSRHDELQRDIVRVAGELSESERGWVGAMAELHAWETEWAAAVAPLALTPEIRPSDVVVFLDRAARWQELVDGAARDQILLHSMNNTIDSFEADVDAVLAQIAPESMGRDRSMALRQIINRLDTATAAAVSARERSEQLQSKQDELADAADDLAAARGRLQRLQEEVGVTDEASLRLAVEASTQLRDTDALIVDLDDEIITASEGRSAATLEVDLDGVDEVDLRLIATTATAELRLLDDAISATTTLLAEKRVDLTAMDGSGSAAVLADQAEFARAEVDSSMEEYLGLRIASLLLHGQIAAFRAEHQGPILSRAAPWFARLTGQSFNGLDTDTGDDGSLVLEGVRPNGEHVGVSAMSDGTLDQLYLSLRLAAVAADADNDEPLPLILDDVLVNFDDYRSSAALEILGEVAESVQVIVFTHHAHVAELASDALGEAVTVHTLSRRDVSTTSTTVPPSVCPLPVRSAPDETVAEHRITRTLPATPSSPALAHTPAEVVVDTLIEAAQPLGRAEILRRTGITKERWKTTIDPLLLSGRVTKTGAKKGTRYSAVNS